MQAATHQTVTLRRGRHTSPDDGVCVLELASLLAGEPFSDHPTSVCPVIGAFLRRYNDAVGDEHRQCLYAYAAHVVGSRASEEVQRMRAARMVEWTADLRRRRRKWYWLPEAWLMLAWPEISDWEILARRAIRELVHHPATVRTEALALVDELVSLGRSRPVASTGTSSTPLNQVSASRRELAASGPS
jgi:hypothetical protein